MFNGFQLRGRTGAWCYIFLWAFAFAAKAQGGIPAEQLATLKAATVLVIVDTPDEEDSGSGFLISKDAKYGYIATNEHVVAVEEGEQRRVQVVFNSGVPAQEMVLPVEVVAEDEDRDLAILRVRSDKLPEPLKLSSPQPPRETAQVWVLGFPFGDMLATSKLHPSITITTGTITSLRLDDQGKVMRVQVDADVNEGNSGGPIVDATGGLVGIATEKIEDTKIGLGLPPSELEEMLRGRVKEVGFHLMSNQGGKVQYHVVTLLIDPLRQIRSVSLFLIPQDQGELLEPDADGRYGPVSPKMWEFALKPKGREYSSEVSLENPQMNDENLWQQLRLEMADGQFRWTQPARLVVPFSKGATTVQPGPLDPDPLPIAPGNPRGGGQPTRGGLPAGGGDDWLGGAAVAKPGAGSTAGAPAATATNRLLLKEARTESDATFRTVDITGKVTPTMQWSVDGKSLYLLEEGGALHKVSVPEFREEKLLQLGQQARYMALTRAGLAIGLPLLQEVWLLNPDSLQLLKRIPAGGMTGLTGSPALTNVYAVQGDTLSVIDLEAGAVTAQLKAREIARTGPARGGTLYEFKFATVTPDGQYLLCESLESLNRLRIVGNTLRYEEVGPRIGQNSQRLEISADSKYVALPSGGGNYAAEGHPQVGLYATYVYKVTNLQVPVITIASGAYPRALAFDKAAGLLYAQNFETSLIVFTPAGLQEKSFKLGIARGDQISQFLPAPEGRKVLVLTGKTLVWVELPPPGATAAPGDAAPPAG